ncbi:MAG: zinc-dependent alcohol dehydrogenase family protein [Deltaproteobacteria bacterium]|nr:zinc-dependent alcohol dehydrogenase family protein [Deltaproteobacteria bacterium]
MQAMVLERLCDLEKETRPLKAVTLPDPQPGEGDIVIAVSTCGVCHTELDEIEGRTPPAFFPMVLGHQAVGRVVGRGANATRFNNGDRVGVAWIFSACGNCEFCCSGRENLCPEFKATGRDAHGGYAEYMRVPEKFAFAIPSGMADAEAAPLLCAGAIGYRSLRLTGIEDGQHLGLTGFGASAHLVLKMMQHRYVRSRIYVFARSARERAFALELGAVWAGEIGDKPPALLDAVIDTTPVWKPVLEALKCLKPGGRLVINAIRKESRDNDLLMGLDYPAQLWMEKEIKSVANVARGDVSAFLKIAADIPIKPEYQAYALDEANTALLELKQRKIRGAKVLRIGA